MRGVVVARVGGARGERVLAALTRLGIESRRTTDPADILADDEDPTRVAAVVVADNDSSPAIEQRELSWAIWLEDEGAAGIEKWLDRGAMDVWAGDLSDDELEARIRVLAHWTARRRRAARMIDGLRTSRARYRALVQNALDIVAVLDLQGHICYVSPSVRRVLGYAPHQILGESIFTVVHPEDAGSVRTAIQESHVPGVAARVEFRARDREGNFRTIEAVADNVVGFPSGTGIVVNARDVSERRDLEEMLAQQAFFDPLTGLPNRALFMDRIEHALAGQGRRSGAPALLFVDVDGFKKINDTWGHDVGDAALVAVARRISDSMRSGDTASRLGGDEFMVLLESVESKSDVVRVAERIVNALREPLNVMEFQVSVTVSVGVAYAEERIHAKELIRRADMAMYWAKDRGKNRYVVWQPRHDSVRLRRPTPPPGAP